MEIKFVKSYLTFRKGDIFYVADPLSPILFPKREKISVSAELPPLAPKISHVKGLSAKELFNRGIIELVENTQEHKEADE